jgi:hypothetical protein
MFAFLAFLARNPLIVIAIVGLFGFGILYMFFKPWLDIVVGLLAAFFKTKVGKATGYVLIVLAVCMGFFSWGRNYEYRVGVAKQLERENALLRQAVKTLEAAAILTQQTQQTAALAEAETQGALRDHQSKTQIVKCDYDPADIQFYDRRLRGRTK